MASFKAGDGKSIKDGDSGTFELKKGDLSVKVSGKVRSFEQDGETRWEIVTGDSQWTAVGFLPENVLARQS